MTDVKVLSNGESLTKYIGLFYKGFTGLENKYLFDLYDINDDDNFRLSSFETKASRSQNFLPTGYSLLEQENSVCFSVLFTIKLVIEILKNIIEDMFRENVSEAQLTINQSFLLKLTTTKMSRVNGKKRSAYWKTNWQRKYE